MASRYSVNGNKPPFFAKLAEARAYSVGLDEHQEAGGEDDDIEWIDHIYRGDEVTGYVMKVKDLNRMCGMGTYYRWVALDGEQLIPNPMYADGTLMPISKNAVMGCNNPTPGCYGVGNSETAMWIPGGLKGVLRYVLSVISELGVSCEKGMMTVIYNVWDDEGNKIGYVIQRSQGDILYGSADNGWYAIRKNGDLGKDMKLCGGPALDGSNTPLCSRDRVPDLLMSELEAVRRKLKEKLSEEDFERISKKLDIEVMKNKSTEERNADLAEIMALVSENSRRSGKRRIRV